MVGLALVAVAVPVSRRVLDDEPPPPRPTAARPSPSSTAAPRRATSTSSSTTTTTRSTTTPKRTTTTRPKRTTTSNPTTTTAPAPPGIRIQLVPAVSEVTLDVGGVLATTDSSGVVAVAAARGRVPVRFVGYQTVPALEKVRFRQWSDGSRRPRRTVDADGRGNLSIAVDLSYRITVTRPGAPGSIEAITPLGRRSIRTGTTSWVLATRGDVHGARARSVVLRYRFDDLPGRPVLVPSPEALWTLPR